MNAPHQRRRRQPVSASEHPGRSWNSKHQADSQPPPSQGESSLFSHVFRPHPLVAVVFAGVVHAKKVQRYIHSPVSARTTHDQIHMLFRSLHGASSSEEYRILPRGGNFHFLLHARSYGKWHKKLRRSLGSPPAHQATLRRVTLTGNVRSTPRGDLNVQHAVVRAENPPVVSHLFGGEQREPPQDETGLFGIRFLGLGRVWSRSTAVKQDTKGRAAH